MNLREQALEQLESLYQSCVVQKKPHVGYDYDSWGKLEHEFQNEIIQLLDYMKSNEWITYVTDKTKCPMNIKIASKGIDVAEGNVSTLQQSVPIFYIDKNYGVAAANANHFTINNGIGFADIEKLICSKIADAKERENIVSAIKSLKDTIEAEKPIEKGGLSAIGPFLQKHSWLSGPIASLLLQYVANFIKK